MSTKPHCSFDPPCYKYRAEVGFFGRVLSCMPKPNKRELNNREPDTKHPDKEKSDGFQKFVKVLKENVGQASALMAPIIALLAALGPPWPSASAATALTSVLQLIILFYAYVFWKTGNARRMKFSVYAIMASFLLYLGLYVRVFNAPDTSHRDVKGICYTDEARQLISSSYSEEQALKEAGYEPTKIWRPWTVQFLRLSVLVCWLTFCGSLVVFTVSFGQLTHEHGGGEDAPLISKD
jgi:hypothetical protein